MKLEVLISVQVHLKPCQNMNTLRIFLKFQNKKENGDKPGFGIHPVYVHLHLSFILDYVDYMKF